MKPAKDNTFCYYPFSQLTLKDWDEYGIWKTAPCCNSIRPESPDPLQIQPTLRPDNYAPPTQQQIDNAFPEKLFHGPEMTELRESMLRGEKHSACTTCWKMEDRDPENPTSYRLQSHPPELDEFNIDDPQLQCIDFGFGENCNLRCRMCGPGLSNKLRTDYKYFVDNQIDTTGVYQFDWQDAFKKLDQDMIENNIKTPHAPETAITHLRPKSESAVYAWPTEEYDSQWRDILANIHNLRQIKATGGETTVSKPFLEFIDTAIEKDAAKNILLEFHTNSTKFTDKFVDKLMKFKRLHINNSIDSLGKNYEYIRYPMKWDIVDKSMQKLHNSEREDSTLIIGNWSFNVVLSALNAHSIKDLSEYFIDTYVRKGNAQGYTLYLDNLWPEHKFINVQYLPRSIKSDLLNEYKELDNLHKRANIVTSKGRHSNYHIQLNSGIQWLQQTMDIEITDAHRESMRREIKVFDLSRKQDYHDYLHPDVIEYIDNPYKGN